MPASSILLIRPANFAYNAETAVSNAFQYERTDDDIQQKALAEFDAFANALRAAGIDVCDFDDTKDPPKPDAVFPNNWVSFHGNGTVVLYPMAAPNRRIEKRMDIVEKLKERFIMDDLFDLSGHAAEGIFLEGTGSIVFDHSNKIAYAALSPRTNEQLFTQLATQLGYRPISFTATDEAGKKIYHTNVVMCIGPGFAVICSGCIRDEAERDVVVNSLRAGGLELIEISYTQMSHFAGNMLCLTGKEGKQLLVVSRTAHEALDASQRNRLASHCELLPLSIPTIETVGGGSVRCMIAEIFLPKK